MKLEQRYWTAENHWQPPRRELDNADLVFIFGDTTLLKSGTLVAEVRKLYPRAHLFGCSTAGEIQDSEVRDHSLTTTALRFKSTTMNYAQIHLSEVANGIEAGEKLARSLEHKNLVHVFVLSMGLGMNGSDVLHGLSKNLPGKATISGGLAGDLDRFRETFVISGDTLATDLVAVVGLYGNHLQVHSSSYCGWIPFGPERLITRSAGNILYELDGKSALDLYRNYLGKEAEALPGNGPSMPISLCSEGNEDGLVRSVLAIDEKNRGLVFGGDMPAGVYCRFMKVTMDRLIEGAKKAALQCLSPHSQTPPELAMLVSCGGRKQVLRERVEEEVESVRQVLGPETSLTGFYSYGEFSPRPFQEGYDLQNQTMTITTLHEAEDDDAA